MTMAETLRSKPTTPLLGAVVLALALLASACGADDFAIDPSDDPFLAEDELYIEEHREAALESLYWTALPDWEGATPEVTDRLLARAAYVNAVAARLEAGDGAWDFLLPDQVAVVARFDTRVAYRDGIDYPDVLETLIELSRRGRLEGERLVVLAALQADVVTVPNGEVTVVRTSHSYAEVHIRDAQGDTTVVPITDEFEWPKRLQGRLQDAGSTQYAGSALMHRLYISTSYHMWNGPYTSAVDDFMWVADADWRSRNEPPGPAPWEKYPPAAPYPAPKPG